MEQFEGRRSKVMLGVSLALAVAGVVFLLWGEAANTLWVFIDGLIISVAGIAIYYAAGEYRLVIEARYRRLSKPGKFSLLLASCTPWIVMYFFISPLWDFILTAAVTTGACAGYVWLYPGLRGEKREPGADSDTALELTTD